MVPATPRSIVVRSAFPGRDVEGPADRPPHRLHVLALGQRLVHGPPVQFGDDLVAGHRLGVGPAEVAFHPLPEFGAPHATTLSQAPPVSDWITPRTLTGTHVRLVPQTLDHVSGLYAAGGADPEVWRWLSTPIPATEADLGSRTRN